MDDNKKLKPIFFWDDAHKPEDYVVNGIPALKRLALAGVLMSGEMIASYRGLAKCKMPKCASAIGSQDWATHGYKFPDGCEHYVIVHGVWVPGCDDLLELALVDMKKKP
jgi:hypothetical protein